MGVSQTEDILEYQMGFSRCSRLLVIFLEDSLRCVGTHLSAIPSTTLSNMSMYQAGMVRVGQALQNSRTGTLSFACDWNTQEKSSM